MTSPSTYAVVLKRDCATCVMVAPVLSTLANDGTDLSVYVQDDLEYFAALEPIDDTELSFSWHNEIEAVPTVIRLVDGVEEDRTVGWSRADWAAMFGAPEIGADLPEFRPGCGSLSVDPDRVDGLAVKFGQAVTRSRRVEFASAEDEFEAMYDRGWSDGLPLIPPTPERVARMLAGTDRPADEIVGVVAPDLVECTVEKVAINAVMAGCLPEYLPVVLAALEAACSQEFNLHGVLATTMGVGPILVVNGPITQRIGMNADMNCFGQGTRANSTIGRAVQLVVRNVGGGRPGEIDRSAQGNPGKLGMCFAERLDSPWPTIAADNDIDAPDAVTVFAGEAPRIIVDELSRRPESLVKSFAEALLATVSPRMVYRIDALLVLSPEHLARFVDAGWSKDDFRTELIAHLQILGSTIVRGADGIDAGLPSTFADSTVPKFRPGGLLIGVAGGPAGLFSSVFGGWVSGPTGSIPATRPIAT